MRSRGSSQALGQAQPELYWLHVAGLLPLLSEYTSGKKEESLCSAQSTDHILQRVRRNPSTRSAPCTLLPGLPCCLTPLLLLPHLHSQVTDSLTQEQGHPKSSVTGFQNEGVLKTSKQRSFFHRVKTLVYILQLLFKCFWLPCP